MSERPPALVPSSRPRLVDDPFADFERDQLMVFVPAIMSVGLVFSVTTLLRDAMQRTGKRLSRRRISVSAATSLVDLVGPPDGERHRPTLHPRRSYLATALLAFIAAATTTLWAARSYAGSESDVRDIAWVLALGLLASLLGAIFAAASWSIWRSWPAPRPWTLGVLRLLPLTVVDRRNTARPSRRLSEGVIGAAVAVATLSVFIAADRTAVADAEQPLLDAIVDAEWIAHLDAFDLYGSTIISIGFVALIGLSAFRCKVMAIVFPAAFAVSWVATTLLQDVVARSRPIAFGDANSFPSGHMVQAVFIAGLLPTAIGVLTRSRGFTVLAARVVLSGFVLSTALIRAHREAHWPLDAVGGAALGLFVVLGAHWVLAHASWHRSCDSCPWSGDLELSPWRRGVLDLGASTTRVIGAAGVAGALGAAATLFVANTVIGLPTDPEGDGLGSGILAPAQLGLAGLLAVAGLLALRWKSLAAFTMALCATGIGLLAAVEYSPVIAVPLTGALLVPAVLTWLAWQPHETVGSIAALAILTVASLTVTTLGSREVHGHYFGPTHPASAAAPLDSDAEWLWLGGVEHDRATVVAGGLSTADAAASSAMLTLWSDQGSPATVAAPIDEDGVARFELEALESETTYSYSVDITGGVDLSAPDATFTTFGEGPQDLKILVASCARNESNGAVFDVMVDEEPDLYLALGDLHYANLESVDPDDHLRQYGRSLSRPGQSALFRSTPTAYVWDDHDYGPNDADSSSPTRAAVSQAFRQAVPDYAIVDDVDAPVAQAFTLGRVRVVISDTRSQRTETTMLGAAQRRWLIDELVESARSHALVIWANPTPWIGPAQPGTDDWSGFSDERAEIAGALAEANVDNLLMVSGDAHMVAIDDGTNSGFAETGETGFPVLHGAALDRPGSVKGGPYSHGAVGGSGQYGVVEIFDDGKDMIEVVLSGRDWRGEELLRYAYEVAAG